LDNKWIIIVVLAIAAIPAIMLMAPRPVIKPTEAPTNTPYTAFEKDFLLECAVRGERVRWCVREVYELRKQGVWVGE
jgi:hypothetical protein